MLRKLKAIITGSLRYKLLLLVLFPLLVFLPVVLFASIYWSWKFGYDQLYLKVNTDLSVAEDAFSRIEHDYLMRLESLANSYNFRTSLKQAESERLQDQLATIIETSEIDFLHITDLEGNWLFEPPSRAGRRSKISAQWPQALRGSASGGVELYSSEDLRNEDPRLAARIHLPLIETPRAMPTDREAEDRAMVIRVLYPLRDTLGKVFAILDGGVVLNHNFHFVDTLRDLVYGPGSLPEDGLGTVTIFLDDVRISTNVPLTPGERALGTRVSHEVREQVLGKGEVWIDRAFVVNDWYISSYKAILDVNGRRVGMLYAGYLEAPFRRAYLNALALFALAAMLVALVTAMVVVAGARSIFKPIEVISSVVRATQAGEEKRIGKLDSVDEISELAKQLDYMLDRLRESRVEIERAAEQLEQKVTERTEELAHQNQQLQETIKLLKETRQQLVVAAKLAALGELTASVAHEINNPTAVILGNMEILEHELGPQLAPVKREVDLVIEQVYRIRGIVEELLQYARPQGRSMGDDEPIDVNQVLEDTLKFARYELKDKNIQIEKQLLASHKIPIASQELQQVFVNLVVNAAQAIGNAPGVIYLHTRDTEDGVMIIVGDNGPGIAPEHLKRVFDPFFTLGKKSGTGLGLSISYGLVKRNHGEITVESELNKWTRFKIYLLKN